MGRPEYYFGYKSLWIPSRINYNVDHAYEVHDGKETVALFPEDARFIIKRLNFNFMKQPLCFL